MAQAQIALETRPAPSRAWLRFAAAREELKARREQKRTLARMLAERETGIATGARV
jgi:hypothetical protein